MSFLNRVKLLYALHRIVSSYGHKKDHDWFYLMNEFWGDKDADATSRNKYSDPKKYPFKIVAKLKSGKEIGYACVDHNLHTCFIHEVYVDKKYRRKGVATALYDFAEELTGKKVKPSDEAYNDSEIHLSEDAEKFWAARNK